MKVRSAELTFNIRHKNSSHKPTKSSVPSMSRHAAKSWKCGTQCLLDSEACYGINFEKPGYPCLQDRQH